MNNRNVNFLKHLDLKQADLVKIFGVVASTVSNGLKNQERYFTEDRLQQLRDYFKAERPEQLDAFEDACVSYARDKTAFQSASEDDPGTWEFTQLWTFGNQPPEQHDLSFTTALMKDRAGDKRLSLVYAVSAEIEAQSLFNVMAAQLPGKGERARIYLFEIPMLRYFPKFRIFDPQLPSRRLSGHIPGEGDDQFPLALADGILMLCREHRVGSSPERIAEDNEIVSSPAFRLLATPGHFAAGKM